ncbi:hypothetical protein [Agromyces mariniharenae]|uniref:hypothetical protein n=1 Tax=Agromyces mariniharenae TaxID=2604423 RepID=UPI001652C431|nr:hypothetical protein [Agromyces mariniharenae]
MPAPVVISCGFCRFPFTAANAYAVACGATCRRRLFRARERAARLALAAAFFDRV